MVIDLAGPSPYSLYRSRRGLSLDGKRWISAKKKFFIPVKVLSAVFRGKFLRFLRKAYDSGDLKFPGKIANLRGKAA